MHNPDTMKVNAGENSFVHCVMNGTPSMPLWKIKFPNDRTFTLFTSLNLPPRHFFNGSGIVITNADTRMNGTMYQCLLHYIKNDIVATVESEFGMLIVQSLSISTHTTETVSMYDTNTSGSWNESTVFLVIIIGTMMTMLLLCFIVVLLLSIFLIMKSKDKKCELKDNCPGKEQCKLQTSEIIKCRYGTTFIETRV